MIGARIEGVEVIGAEIRGIKPLAVGVLGAALTRGAEQAAARLQASLPERYRDSVKIDLDIGADSIHVGVYLSGQEARAWVSGVDAIVDIASYVREEAMVFGRPVSPIIESVRAHQRRLHIAAHGDLAAIIADGSQQMADAAIAAASDLGSLS